MIEIKRHQDARAFLVRAECWLLQAEAENNLLLGIVRRMAEVPGRYELPIYLATVEDDGSVVGCAFRTPPHKLGLTRMPEGTLPFLVNDVAQVYEALPAVLGPHEVAQKFSELWGKKREVNTNEGMKQRIYQLDNVLHPEQKPSGHIRVVEKREVDIAAEWINSFSNAVSDVRINPKRVVEDRISEEGLFFWDDGRPVSIAGWSGRTANGVRIGFVYTPPLFRGKGYATACVADLSERLLDSGLKFCFLYTDLSNPVSNNIYLKIGYKPVCDVMDYVFNGNQ